MGLWWATGKWGHKKPGPTKPFVPWDRIMAEEAICVVNYFGAHFSLFCGFIPFLQFSPCPLLSVTNENMIVSKSEKIVVWLVVVTGPAIHRPGNLYWHKVKIVDYWEMKKQDGRKLSNTALEARRRIIIRMKENGSSPAEIVIATSCSRQAIYPLWKNRRKSKTNEKTIAVNHTVMI